MGDEDLVDPPRAGAAVLVPADGRAAPAAQPDPHRSSTSRTTRRRRASRRRSPRAVTSSATRTRRGGGPWPTPRATRSTSPLGRTATEASCPREGRRAPPFMPRGRPAVASDLRANVHPTGGASGGQSTLHRSPGQLQRLFQANTSADWGVTHLPNPCPRYLRGVGVPGSGRSAKTSPRRPH